MGAEAIGKLHLALSVWAIGAVFVTFGMDLLLTKEIARDPTKAAALITTTAIIRIPLFMVSFAAVMLYTNLANTPAETVPVIIAIGIGQLIWQFGAACRASFEGLEQMQHISYADIASKAFNTFVSIALLFLGYGVVAIAIVNIGMAVVYTLVMLRPLSKSVELKFEFDLKLVWWMLKAGVPYLFIFGLAVLYVQVDAIVIANLVNEVTLGWYSAADMLFGTMLFVPSVFITAIFPILSRMHSNESDSLPHVMNRSFNLLLLLSVPIGLGVAVIATPLIVLISGAEFVNSGPVLSVMGIVLMFMYQNILLGRFLISIDRQNTWTIVMGVAVVGTILLDIILVPYFHNNYGNGAIGGAVAYAITEGVMLTFGLYLLRDNLDRGNISVAARTLIAGIVMAAAVYPAKDLPLILPILIGAIVYAAMVYLLKLVPPEDLAMARDLLPARFKTSKSYS